jgi:hypothetical protein
MARGRQPEGNHATSNAELRAVTRASAVASRPSGDHSSGTTVPACGDELIRKLEGQQHPDAPNGRLHPLQQG